MLGLNMPLELPFLIHGLVADPTTERPILSHQNKLFEILWGWDCSWISKYETAIIFKWIYSNKLIIQHLIFRVGSFFMVPQSYLGSNNMWALRALIGEYIWKVLSFNVLFKMALLIHGLIADPTIEWSIFRSEYVLVKILWIYDVA